MWQNAALILMGLGVLALIGWSVQAFFMDGEVRFTGQDGGWGYRGEYIDSHRRHR